MARETNPSASLKKARQPRSLRFQFRDFRLSAMLRSLRNAFITGIVVILPLGVTMIVIRFLLDKIGNPTEASGTV